MVFVISKNYIVLSSLLCMDKEIKEMFYCGDSREDAERSLNFRILDYARRRNYDLIDCGEFRFRETRINVLASCRVTFEKSERKKLAGLIKTI